MKKIQGIAIAMIVLAWGSLAGAAVVAADDFNREDGYLTGTGTNWTSTSSGGFYLVSNRAVNNSASGINNVAWYTGLNTSTNAFSVQATVATTGADELVGLAFNVQDGSNFYVVRVKQNGSWTQVFKVTGGAITGVYVNTASNWTSGSTIRVSGDGSGNFTVVVGTTTFTFSDTTLSGGSVGLYYVGSESGGTISWDDFSATSSARVQVADNFNRNNGYLAGAGTNWTTTSSGGFYIISNRAVNSSVNGVNNVAWYTGLDTLNEPFTVQATVTTTGSNEFVGLAFNVQDGSNFYAVRVIQNGSWTQILKVTNGSITGLFANAASGWTSGSSISVSGDGIGNYTVSLGTTYFTFNDTTFSGGSVGLYYTGAAAGGSIAWDNFSATASYLLIPDGDMTLLNVDLMDAGEPFSRDLLGANIVTEDSREINYQPTRYYESLSPLQTPVVRFPGGLLSNSYHWAQTLGPVANRTPQWGWNHTLFFSPVCGAGDFLTLLTQIGAKGMITLNVCDGTAEEAAAWVAFCRGSMGDFRQIGIDKNGVNWQTVDYWACKRFQETGLVNPVDVVYWELGNELIGGPKFTGYEFDTVQEYVQAVLPVAAKIRQIDQNIDIGWVGIDPNLLMGYADLVDFVIVHYYTGWPKGAGSITMWTNGTVTGEFACSSAGTYTISLEVSGLGITDLILQGNLSPQVNISIDGTIVDTRTLTPYGQQLTYTPTLQSGNHTVQVTFLNDYCQNGEDTNVWVKKAFTVTGSNGTQEYEFAEIERPIDLRGDAASMKTILVDVAEDLEPYFPNAFIAITEYNRMECACFDMGTALYNAEMISLFSEVPEAKTAQIFEACSWNFGLMASHNGIHRPVYYAFQMMKDLLGQKMPVQFITDEPDLCVLATADPVTNRFAILLLNFSSSARAVKLYSPHRLYSNIEQTFIHADSYDVDNESGEIITPKTRTPNTGIIELPGTSISMITGDYTPIPDTTQQILPGDANGDGMVDVGDLGILAANYGGAGKSWNQGDFNGDGAVDVGDLGILAANYGSSNFNADYAQAFGVAVDDDAGNEDAISSSVCSGLGLPLIAGLALMGLMLVKFEE